MGLISYFERLHYDNKLKKADKLLAEGRGKEAEEIYSSILDKQPLAVGKLASFYFSQAPKADVKTDIDLYKKVVELEKKGKDVYDVQSYNSVLVEYGKHMNERAANCFKSGSFTDCSDLLTAVNASSQKSNDSLKFCAESNMNLLFGELKANKVTSSSFSASIDSFKSEWKLCKSVKRAKQSALQFCSGLEQAKRYFASNTLLEIILDNTDDSSCLDNATQIISGNDIEINSDIIKSVVSSYEKKIVLRSGQKVDESVALFNACWRGSSDTRSAIDTLMSATDEDLKNALVSSVLSNSGDYLCDASFFASFTKWLHDSFSDKNSVILLEKVHDLGYDVENYYTDKVHALISDKACEEKLRFLDHAQMLFPKSSIILSDKLACAQWYLDKEENDKAISVADSIIMQCAEACVVKSRALCNKANNAKTAEQKNDLLKLAETALSGYKGNKAKDVETCIKDAYVHTANKYYSEDNRDKAYEILSKLARGGFESAAFVIASLRLSEVRAAATMQEKENTATAAINEIIAYNISSIPQCPDYLLLWNENIDSTVANTQSIDNISAVEVLQKLIDGITSAGFDTSVAKAKKDVALKELIRRKYLIAKENEQSNKISEACELYREINILEAKRTPTLSALRFVICKLKLQDHVDILGHKERVYTLLRNSANAFVSEKNEIAYRFALTLLKSGEDKEAQAVLAEFLPSEELLKKACEQGDMIKAQAKLDDFNNKLEAVKDKSLSSNDALYVINHILEYGETIKPILEISRPMLGRYRNKLKNYAIYKLFDEGRFDIAFEKMIKEHQDYLDDLTALRNISLVCLNMAESKQINNENYQEVIAVWLTAIYQEQLFVKSLEYTSWDDSYTFSLYEAFGHFNEESVGDLPENVNFDDSDEDNVVYIKDVQRALLDRFEAAISDSQHYHEFFSSQKDAMDSFIALNLDEKCRLVAPYLAHKNDELFQEISDALEQDRRQEYSNWEDVISVGAIYQMPQDIYKDYSKAKSCYAACIESVDHNDLAKVKQSYTSDNIELICRFDKLGSALKSYSNSKVSALSAKNKTEFRANYYLYLVVCRALRDSTLSYAFSNFVMQYVVGEVNGNTMSKADASELILSIFLLDKSNTRVKENLTTLFEMLARENDSKSIQAVNNVLSGIRTFDVSLYKTLNREREDAAIHKELNAIVDKVNKNTLTMSNALKQVYDMYSSHPNHEGICENLAQLSSICIMKYVVNQESGYSSVQTILDSLKNNISTEFRKHTAVFKKQHDEIWNSLPQDTKYLLNGSFLAKPGQSLNDKGYALKRGLQYMRDFGGFTQDDADDILSLLSRINRHNDLPF